MPYRRFETIAESAIMISFCPFGAGRIGAIHAENIARHPGGCRIALAPDRPRHRALMPTPEKAGKQGELPIPPGNLAKLFSIKTSGSDT
jgi:hypothetical protein